MVWPLMLRTHFYYDIKVKCSVRVQGHLHLHLDPPLESTAASTIYNYDTLQARGRALKEVTSDNRIVRGSDVNATSVETPDGP